MIMACSVSLKKALFITANLILGFSFNTTFAFSESSLDGLINRYVPSSYVGIIVGDAKTGEILYEKNSHGLFTPASNLKLFTAAAALYSLGPKYRFKTEVGIRTKNLRKNTLNDNLYIHFSGDPSLTTKDLEKLIQDVKNRGISHINGNIVLDTAVFDKPDYGNEWALEDINWSFGAPVNSIIIDENAVNLTIVPAKTMGEKPVVILALPEKQAYIKIDNQLQTVPHEQALKHCSMDIQIDQDNTIRLNGCIDNSTDNASVALRNPLAYTTAIIKANLAKQYIKLDGNITSNSIPSDLNFITKINSKPLHKLTETMLKNSNNIFAESFIKTLGYTNFGHGTFQEGVNAVKDVLGPKTNIDFTKMKIVDGSGTSHNNLVTPYSIYRLLYTVYNDKKIKGYFIKALAEPAEKGSLKKRLASFDSIKSIQAKTGSAYTVSALSGYLTTQNGRQLIFSILINNFDDIKLAKNLENELCLAFIHSKL